MINLLVLLRISLLLVMEIAYGLTFSQTSPGGDHGSADWKLWSGLNADLEFSKKWEMSMAYIHSMNLQPAVSTSFDQFGGSIDYQLTRILDASTGAIITRTPANGENTYRYFLRTNVKANLGRQLRWTNGVLFEKYSSNETRYDSRLIYITRLGCRKRIDFLALSPSISYWLYYNIGGNAIPQYDDQGQKLGKKVPSGWHRGRLIVNLNSKINDLLSVSIYYFRQQEFNLFTPGHNINVRNPDTGKIYRPFDNYNVAGVSLKLNI